VPAPAAGVLGEILLHSDQEAAPGAVLGRISAAEDVVRRDPETRSVIPAKAGTSGREVAENISAETRAFAGGKRSFDRELRLSPAVKRGLIQHDLNPADIEGTGRAGRLTRADVDKAAAGRTAGPEPQPSTHGAASRSVPHDRMRLRIAENMLNSVTQAPHVTAVFECDFSAIIAHRAAHKDSWGRQGIKLTYTAYLVAAAAEAMKVAPAINSRWHPDRLEIFDDINVGVGTALGGKGLIVPVLRQVQRLSLQGIGAGLHDLVERARAEKLTSADVKGGTFTISNHGVSGSLLATPIIINQPQSAILGVGKLEKRVVVREVDGADAIQIRPLAYVSLTIDHRVVDGHQTNAWLSRFVDILESWPVE
jgi:2-oxoglutarate dehydrogenase E2 component (dihydrolipoamide succinyltransferase)